MTTFSSVTARDCITSTRLHFLSSIDSTRAKVVSSSVGHRAPLVQSLLSIDNLLDNSHSLKIINQAFLRREGIFFKTKVGKVRLLRTNETRRGSMARARYRFLFMPAILRHDGTPSCFYGHPTSCQPSFSSACGYIRIPRRFIVSKRSRRLLAPVPRRDSRPLFPFQDGNEHPPALFYSPADPSIRPDYILNAFLADRRHPLNPEEEGSPP